MAVVREYGVLGPLEARVDGRSVDITTPKLRVLLAALLVSANRVVPVERLVGYLWDEPPASARKTVQIYVLRLRRLLGDDPDRPDVILTRPDGYLVSVADEHLDLSRFTAAATAAGRTDDPAGQAALLDRAEASWRGPALADVPSDSLRREVGPWLAEERVRAAERRARAYLELGRHAELVGDLVLLTEEHPWREPLWAHLVIALHRSGRQADALATYRAVDQRFRTELGVDVGPELRAAHQAVLSAERPVGQLPADLRGFAGRHAELAALEALLSADDSPVALISGAPGVGKTALAVRAAHRVRSRFPDGQLHADLRGFAAEPALEPAVVLARFLAALGVPPGRVPAELDERAAMFRSVVADRRVLIVLDDAASPAQVRPLLPGVPGCAVLLTSRHDLRGLGVRQALDRVRLSELDPAGALAVLAAQLGPDRCAAEPEAVSRLAALCGYLPLALRIAGAHLSADPYRRVSDYAASLSGPDRLARLSVDGDESSALLSAYTRSCAGLRPDDRTTLRRLASVGDFGSTEAAELLGTSPWRRCACWTGWPRSTW
ncbi:BTAD domain-containing putative transcriptional regulator [Actinokineospora soli]|uniref:BTAD domain-containing putative transcriptional regulator n=1 Tax=Actinokineospora soli TaxID=1048753 RepID=A0ABW2TUT7_9PSEU